MSQAAAVKLADLRDFICCPLCKDYLTDATTINECLHTFCRTCIIKHITQLEANHCPLCEIVIHQHRPLDYIKYDQNKQDIVYKLVPQLYASTHGALKTIHVGLTHQTNQQKTQRPIYLECPIDVNIYTLRKLLVIKFQLEPTDQVTILYKGDIVSDDDQVSNLSQSSYFHLNYEIVRAIKDS